MLPAELDVVILSLPSLLALPIYGPTAQHRGRGMGLWCGFDPLKCFSGILKRLANVAVPF